MAKSLVSLAPPDEPWQGAADWGEKPTNGEADGLACRIIGSGVPCGYNTIRMQWYGIIVWKTYGVVWKPTNGESDATCGECSGFLRLHISLSLKCSC